MSNQVFHFSNTGISSGQRFYLKDDVSGIFLRNLVIDSNFPVLGSNLVYNTGNQTINGLKDFATRPTVNTIPVALSGEASSSIEQLVKNDYGATLYKGQPVYVYGSNGNNILIKPASNTGESTSSKTFGLLKQNLLTNEFGYVVTEGPLLNADTSMATDGDPIWLGPTGNLIFGLANKPKAPNHLVYLGFVERAHQNQGKIFVKAQNGFEIDELHDVRIVDKQNSDIIIYNTGSGLWLNSGVDFGSFYTKNNPSGYITNQNVVYTTGYQTIGGIKTFSSVPVFNNGTDLNNKTMVRAVPSIVSTATAPALTDADHNGRVIYMANSTPVTITIPPGLSVGFNCSVIQGGGGSVTIDTGVGVTLNSYLSSKVLAGIYATVSIVSVTQNNYIMYGNTL